MSNTNRGMIHVIIIRIFQTVVSVVRVTVNAAAYLKVIGKLQF